MLVLVALSVFDSIGQILYISFCGHECNRAAKRDIARGFIILVIKGKNYDVHTCLYFWNSTSLNNVGHVRCTLLFRRKLSKSFEWKCC